MSKKISGVSKKYGAIIILCVDIVHRMDNENKEQLCRKLEKTVTSGIIQVSNHKMIEKLS